MTEVEDSEIILACKSVYEDQLSLFKGNGQKIIMSRFGAFSQDLINRLSESAEELLISFGEKKAIVKRMFTILIEGLQNIKIHGELDKDGQQLAFSILAKNNEGYKLCFANLIEIAAKDSIKHQIESLNNLNEAEVKSLYVDTLSNGIISQKGGAGLGFITMRLRSKNSLICHFDYVSDELILFTVEVNLSKDSE